MGSDDRLSEPVSTFLPVSIWVFFFAIRELFTGHGSRCCTCVHDHLARDVQTAFRQKLVSSRKWRNMNW